MGLQSCKANRKRVESVPNDAKNLEKDPFKKLSFDHLDSGSSDGIPNNRYGLVIHCEGSNGEFFHPTVNRKTAGVVQGIKKF